MTFRKQDMFPSSGKTHDGQGSKQEILTVDQSP